MKSVDLKGQTYNVGDGDKNLAEAPGGTAKASGGVKGKGADFAIRPYRPGYLRSLNFALRLGHCAPAAMAALLDDDDPGREKAILVSSAMAGGIGSSGAECGALTSSILFLGQGYANTPAPGGVPASIILSERLIERFGEVHGGTRCDQIRKGGKNPLPCMKAMVSAPQLVEEVINEGPPSADAACLDCHTSGLLSACQARRFHCAHSVFAGLSGIVPECGRLTDMTYPLIGGFALSGGTCTAAAAGVLAIGLATGQAEDSYVRVAGMMARMFIGGDAMMMADPVNNFNPAINRGGRLIEWFSKTYGTVRCQELTGIDIRKSETAGSYFGNGGLDRCEGIAAAVAAKVREIIESGSNTDGASPRVR